MATRPIFQPLSNTVGVKEQLVDFKWHPGMSAQQKKKSITELHNASKHLGFTNLLEISSKSEIELGINLSAFNLLITTKKNNKLTVETAFQGSKVFDRGGPFKDLFGLDSRAAKKDIRLKESGNLKCFRFFSSEFPLIPRTYFYDWIYINALIQNKSLARDVLDYHGFSDIEFNPKRSINCQAHAVALYISLKDNDLLNDAMLSPKEFLNICSPHYKTQERALYVQPTFI